MQMELQHKPWIDPLTNLRMSYNVIVLVQALPECVALVQEQEKKRSCDA